MGGVGGGSLNIDQSPLMQQDSNREPEHRLIIFLAIFVLVRTLSAPLVCKYYCIITAEKKKKALLSQRRHWSDTSLFC